MPYCLHYPSWLFEHPAEKGRGRKRKEEEKGQKKKEWEGWGREERRERSKEVKEWEEKERKTSGDTCTRNELFKKLVSFPGPRPASCCLQYG